MKILYVLISLLLIISSQIIAQTYPPVYVVLFTHIEDNTPSSDLNTPQARIQYMSCRSGMIGMAKLAQKYNVQWSFEPDWKILIAALSFEDSAAMQNTNGKNFLRYLKDDLNVAIDAHSHEKQGYNYTDVAHLLDSLGTGGSTVIGGHVWDPSLPQFQNWDRFRVPVSGTKYPWAIWRGDILMGSGTPNHVNDPVISGIWRPQDRNNYFTDDPNGNIYCIGQYKEDISSIPELIDLYRSEKVQPDKILTASFHIQPLSITTAGGLQAIEDTIIKPLVAMRSRGEIILTDFTSLISEWKKRFNSVGHIYDPTKIKAINWKPFFTLNPDEGMDWIVDTTEIAPGGVPVINLTNDERVILNYSGNAGAFEVRDNGANLLPVTVSKNRAPDGGVIYLPDGRMRFLGEQMSPNGGQGTNRRSYIVSSISNDGINWMREQGIRFQPGVSDDSISSVPSFIQIQDSVWRMYYVGDFKAANGTRTAITTDWGWTWKSETTKNILTFTGDVDPHPMYLSNGKYRLYFRTGFTQQDPAKRGLAYCDSDDGVTFDTTEIHLMIADNALPPSNKLDPWVIKYPDGNIACYFGAAPPPNIPNGGPIKLICAWAKQKPTHVSPLPDHHQISMNAYPNPFSTLTIVDCRFTIEQQEKASFKIYDIFGRMVLDLSSRVNSNWSLVIRNSDLPSQGIYFYRLTIGKESLTKMMVMLR